MFEFEKPHAKVGISLGFAFAGFRLAALGNRLARVPIRSAHGNVVRAHSGGQFEMGTPPTEPQRESQETLHHVTISRAFYLAIHEVTQREWRTVMGGQPSHFSACGPDCPVEEISFYDVERLIAQIDGRSGWAGFRLPTEAEWEYACRAGGTEAFGASSSLTTDAANYDGRYPYDGAAQDNIDGRRRPLARSLRIAGGCSTCRATSGSGPRTRIVRIPAAAVRDPIAACRSDGESDSRRQLVLRRRQRALRAPLYAPAAGSRIQPRRAPRARRKVGPLADHG